MDIGRKFFFILRFNLIIGLFGLCGFWIESDVAFGLLEKPLELKVPFETHTLSNGLTVITVEDPKASVVSYQTWFQVGSVDETPGLTGVTHAFEHLMFKGTKKYGPRQIFQILEAEGANINAFVTRDYAVFYEEFFPRPGLLEKVIDLEADRLAGLEFDDDAVNNERMILFEERRLKSETGVESRMLDTLWGLAYRRHPYQWPVMGNPMDVLNFTPAYLSDYYKKYFQPGNATLIVIGNFKTPELMKFVKKYYGSIEGRSRPKRSFPTEPPQGEERRFVIREKSASERFAQGFHICSAWDEDSYALDILSNILFEGSSARARHRLVEQLNWVNSLAGSAYTPAYPGMFIIYGSMKAGVPYAKLEAELWKLIVDIQEHSVKPEEVRTAVKQLSLQVVDGIRSPHGIGQLLGTVQSIFKDPKRFSHELDRYQSITPADIQRVAKKYFDLNNRTVVTVMPPK